VFVRARRGKELGIRKVKFVYRHLGIGHPRTRNCHREL
jgi:hypothetical protein